MDGSQDFAAARLSFEVAGDGVTIDPATGRLSLATDQLQTGVTVLVTATDAAGAETGRFRLTLAALAVETAPVLVAAPALAGPATVGAAVTLDPGTWEGVPVPEIAVAWLLDGLVLDGAAGLAYTPRSSDDGKALAARVTATNAAGSAVAETAGIAVAHRAPAVAGTLADVVADAGGTLVAVDAAAAFAGLALTFAVSGQGATIDSATGS